MSLSDSDGDYDEESIYDLIIWPKNATKPFDKISNEKAEFISIPSSNPDEKITFVISRAENPLTGNPIVVFGHGNGERMKDYYYENDFCPHGISICTFDYRGYGFSDGKYGTSCFTEPDDIITIIKYLKENGFEKVSYFGRSLGATCGIFVAAEFPDLVCVALDSPWLSTREWTKYKADFFNDIKGEKFQKLLPTVYQKIKEETGLDFNQIKEPRFVASKISQPLFLIHGEQDYLVPFSNSSELIELVASQEKIFKPFKGDHNFNKERVKLFYEMFDFILKHNGVEIQNKE